MRTLKKLTAWVLSLTMASSLLSGLALTVSADDMSKPMTVTYNEQSDTSKIYAKAMIFRSFIKPTPLCPYLNIELY